MLRAPLLHFEVALPLSNPRILSSAVIGLLLAACGTTAPLTGTVLTCLDGRTACGNSCVLTKSDPKHCGACGTVCGKDQVCTDGACTTTCGPGLSACADGSEAGTKACVDSTSNRDHCGACGTKCGAGELCINSACTLVCGDGKTKCGAECVTLGENPHCGACGVACGNGTACVSGKCLPTCATGGVLCAATAGNAASCKTLSSDNANCGACGKVCGTGQTCSSGLCVAECSGTQTRCTGSGGATYCSNTQTDSANCGACGNACAKGNCVAGKCEEDCPSGLSACGMGAGRTCVDKTDNANCGTCGNACAMGQFCSGGACTTTCGVGTTKCTVGTRSACIDTHYDPRNCNGCGVACAAGQTCNAGVCTAIPTQSCKQLWDNTPARSRQYMSSGLQRLLIPGVGAVEATCDFDYEGGGWTLIYDSYNRAAPQNMNLTAPVTFASNRAMPTTVMQRIADVSTQVHLRTTQDPGRSITSTPGSYYPIQSLRNGGSLQQYGNNMGWYTGPFATNEFISYSCGPASVSWPNIFHACGNSEGLHLIQDHNRWKWFGGDTNRNEPMQLWVR